MDAGNTQKKIAMIESILTQVGIPEMGKCINKSVLPVRAYVNCSEDEMDAFELETDYDKEDIIHLSLLGISLEEAVIFLKLFLANRKIMP